MGKLSNAAGSAPLGALLPAAPMVLPDGSEAPVRYFAEYNVRTGGLLGVQILTVFGEDAAAAMKASRAAGLAQPREWHEEQIAGLADMMERPAPALGKLPRKARRA